MSEMMKCFVMHGIGKVGVMEKPVPRAGPSDAIIRTTAALICTSDTHTVAGAIGDRHGLTLGHEAVGVIHELGELAAASGLFKIGQRVAVSAITPCYACDNCQRGYPSQCGGMLGGWKFANLKDGSFAEFFHVNNAVANLAPIPDGLSDEQAAYCCDMLSTGFVAAEFANIPIGGSVAIFSQGPVGMMATVGAASARCGAGHRRRVHAQPHRNGEKVWLRRDRGLHAGRFRRSDPQTHGRQGRGFGDRGSWQRANFRRVRKRDATGRDHLQRRLPRRRRQRADPA